MLAIAVGVLAHPAAALPGDPGPAQPPTPKPKPTPRGVPAPQGVPRLIFPVVGPASYEDDFGDPRGQGRHEGIDIVAPKRALAVAAEAGTVKFHTTSWRAGCMLYLSGRSGTEYLYVHLNNDVSKGNDNTGKCVAGVAYAKGLKDGERVAAGEPIGYVGDSGDADGIHPHLHFEVHPKAKEATNPFPYLHAAQKLLFAAKPGTTVDLTLEGAIVEALDGVLSLKVDRLEARPTGLRVAKVDRTVDLAVPATAAVFNPVGALVAAAKLLQAEPGEGARVDTLPTEATLKAQLGAPLALSAATITLRG